MAVVARRQPPEKHHSQPPFSPSLQGGAAAATPKTTTASMHTDMPDIHLIEQKGNIWKVKDTTDEWESGYWVVAEATAAKLVGGDLYLHSKQAEPSHFGGTILGFRVQPDGEVAGRFIFRFKATINHRGVLAGQDGWGNEKKLVGVKSAA